MRRMRPPGGSREPDLRAGLLSIACLLFILLPCLMLTTSLYRLTALPFSMPARGEGAAGPPSTVLETLEIHIQGEELLVRAAMRTTDVTAKEGNAVWNETRLAPKGDHPDVAALQDHLVSLHRLDPAASRVTVVPLDGTPTDRLVWIMDAVRQAPDGSPLFNEITLGSAEAAP